MIDFDTFLARFRAAGPGPCQKCGAEGPVFLAMEHLEADGEPSRTIGPFPLCEAHFREWADDDEPWFAPRPGQKPA